MLQAIHNSTFANHHHHHLFTKNASTQEHIKTQLARHTRLITALTVALTTLWGIKTH